MAGIPILRSDSTWRRRAPTQRSTPGSRSCRYAETEFRPARCCRKGRRRSGEQDTASRTEQDTASRTASSRQGLDTLPAGVRHDLPAVVPAAAGAYLLNSFLQEDYNSLCGPPELHGQSLHICVPFGAMPATMLSEKDAKTNPLQPIEKIERFGGATPPIVVASVETGCVKPAVGECTPLDGRYVVNLVSVHFDHFEAVSRGSTSCSRSSSATATSSARGLRMAAQPATGGEQGEIDEAYNEPLRPLLHTLPCAPPAATTLSTLRSTTTPSLARRTATCSSRALPSARRTTRPRALPRLRRAADGGRAAPAVRRRQGAQALRSNPLQTVGIAGAPGYQPTPKWAQVTDEMRPPTVMKGGNPVPAPNSTRRCRRRCRRRSARPSSPNAARRAGT